MTDSNNQGLDKARVLNRDYYRKAAGRSPSDGSGEESTDLGSDSQSPRFSGEPLRDQSDFDSAA